MDNHQDKPVTRLLAIGVQPITTRWGTFVRHIDAGRHLAVVYHHRSDYPGAAIPAPLAIAVPAAYADRADPDGDRPPARAERYAVGEARPHLGALLRTIQSAADQNRHRHVIVARRKPGRPAPSSTPRDGDRTDAGADRSGEWSVDVVAFVDVPW
ncbi:MAG: hypothetical protein J2P26_01910, partial [Nocardiopsaceae bacterium]|nr:hypothetical protein [Nocardiopsaceae bacterium]